MKQNAPHWHNLSHIYRPSSLRSHLMQSRLHSQWLGNAFLPSVWALKAFLLCFFDSGARALWLNYHPSLAGLAMTEGFMTNLQNRKWQFLVGLWRFSFYSHLAYLKMSGSVILEAQILYFTLVSLLVYTHWFKACVLRVAPFCACRSPYASCQHWEQARGHHPQWTQRVCGQIPWTSWK